MKKAIYLIIISCIFSCQVPIENDNQVIGESKEIKDATSFTSDYNNSVQSELDFNDQTDFENAQKGFIASLNDPVIKNPDGSYSIDIGAYGFIEGNPPAEANPSLWRQSKLNAMHGLFQLNESIYQVRALDLANMTLIKGKTGWIIIDPLTTSSTAKAAMDLVNEHVGEYPVKAVIFTHSHIDHFGGVKGVITQEQVDNGEVEVYAPKDFFEHAVSENVMAGNTMGRRATYMYGNLLEKSVKGSYGSGLGTTTASGEAGLIRPTVDISSFDGEEHIIDGLKVEFIFTPESEAPAEMMFYFPELNALCQSENVNHTLHNLYTLRGAQVRNGQKWSQYIDKSLAKWGKDVTLSFGSHHWPTWGNEEINKFLVKQRDLYRFIHDQTLRLANQGYTPKELAEMIKLPSSLSSEFYNRGYYGSVSHDIKAQYQLYFGWFDGNPANLNPLPPAEAGNKYVEAFGGADKLLTIAQNSYDNGEYRWVAELVNHVVFAQPENQAARNLLADTYEQLGYQAESGPWRNFYLTGAMELRNGVKPPPISANPLQPDIITGMSPELYFNFLGMQFNGIENPDMKYNFNIELTDINEKLALIISNGAVMPRLGEFVEEDVTATIQMSKKDLDRISLGQAKLVDLIDNGTVKVEGDKNAYLSFLSKLETFEFWFPIVTP